MAILKRIMSNAHTLYAPSLAYVAGSLRGKAGENKEARDSTGGNSR